VRQAISSEACFKLLDCSVDKSLDLFCRKTKTKKSKLNRLRSIQEETEQVRLRIPISIKQRLDSIAQEKGIKLNSVLLLFIDSLLRRKPDLYDVLDESIGLLRIERELQAQQMKVVNAYNMMSLHFTPQNRRVDDRCKVFLTESEIFVRQLSEKKDE